MTESEFRETVLRLIASPVDGLSFEDKAAIVKTPSRQNQLRR